MELPKFQRKRSEWKGHSRSDSQNSGRILGATLGIASQALKHAKIKYPIKIPRANCGVGFMSAKVRKSLLST